MSCSRLVPRSDLNTTCASGSGIAMEWVSDDQPICAFAEGWGLNLPAQAIKLSWPIEGEERDEVTVAEITPSHSAPVDLVMLESSRPCLFF